MLYAAEGQIWGAVPIPGGCRKGVRSRDNPPPQPRPVEAHLSTAMRSPLGAPGGPVPPPPLIPGVLGCATAVPAAVAAAAAAAAVPAAVAVPAAALPAGMPSLPPPRLLERTTGPCLITDGGSCATSPDFPNDYPVDEGCTIYSLPPVGLDVIAFDVEGDEAPSYDSDGHGDPTNDCPYDHLTVNGVKYCGTSGPAGVVPSDGTMTWVSDDGVTVSGWKACAPFSASVAPCTLPS